jgi:alcohol dehydrogenase (cytochrome c)
MLYLDPDTRNRKWGFKYTPNDGWYYDSMSTPILIDATIDGKERKTAVVSNRNGFFYVIDRSNGECIYTFPMVEGINWTNGLDPKTCKPSVNEAMKPKSGGGAVEPIVPGLEGGTNWFPPAYDPTSGLFYVSVNQWGMGLTAWERGRLQYKPGDMYMGVDYQMYRMGDTIGHLRAVDVANKKVVWDVPSSLPLFAGVLATKGGLIFTGDQRGRFLAYDAKTGKELWSFQTGSAINASPMTYELDGHQYVAILSGLGGDPSFYYSAPKGGMLWVFSVGGKVDEGNLYNAVVIEKMLPNYKKQ